MARRKLSHLGTRGGVFWVRIAVPRDLCDRLRRREWKFSLRTREPRLAKLKCLEATLAIERLQSVIRAMPALTDAQIASTAKAYLEWALRHAVDGASLMAGGPFKAIDDNVLVNAQSIQQLDDGTPKKERQAVQRNLDRLRGDLVAQKLDWAAKPLAAEFASERGFDFDKVDPDSRDALLHALQRARIEEYRIRLALLDGDYANAVVRDPLFDGLAIPLRANWTAPTKPVDEVPTLNSAITRFKKSKNTQDAWVGKTIADHERVLAWLLELNDGDAPITAITKAAIRDFADALPAIPANLIKSPEFKNRPLREVLAAVQDRTDYVRLSQATQAKYFSKLKSFFTWCEDQGYGPSPVGRIAVSEPRNAVDQRLPFRADQLKTLFNCPQYRGHFSMSRRSKPGTMIVRDGKYWIPLIGLFGGMRLGEIVQLQTTDFRQIESIWCFDVARSEQDDEEPAKQIKTWSSVRIVPVHPILIDLGLVEYHMQMRREGKKRLFSDIKPGKDGYYSHNFSKYFSRLLKAIGIKTKKNSFHSFRHNFGEGCDRAGVSLLIRELLMGHADDSSSSRYRDPEGHAPTLFREISRVKFDVDLSHLAAGHDR